MNTHDVVFFVAFRKRIVSGSRTHKRMCYKRLLYMNINNVVVNLSNVELTYAEFNVLNRGLGFVPSHTRYSPSMLAADIDRFERKLQLFHFFASKGDDIDMFDTNDSDNVFRPTSTWMPSKLSSSISAFCQRIHTDLVKLLLKPPRPNLPPKEVQALKDLRSRDDIVIKPADKGGGICVLDAIDYQTKIYTMLNDTSIYEPVTESDHLDVKRRADILLTALHTGGFLTDKQLQYLTDFRPRCPVFYGLPKVHKPNAPLRPIVSQIHAPTCMVNELVDKLLTVAEKCVPNLFQDTTAFLNLLEKHKIVTPNSLLVTMDVASLYTNIPHVEGVDFVASFYEETLPYWHLYQPGIPPIPTNDLKILMKFILTNCTFQFSDNYFRQKYGTTMGARFSVKFANIYMHVWFKTYLAKFKGVIFDFIGRLIDDVFTIWTHGREQFDRLFVFLNNCHPSIRFEADISTHEVHFLDTIVSITDGQLHTRVYTKPTDKKQFLFYSSCHPLHVKNAIPYSQTIRYRRNTDDDEQFSRDLQTLTSQFRSRGYPTAIIMEAIDKIKSMDRQRTLIYTSKAAKRSRFRERLGDRAFLPLITIFFAQFDFNVLKPILHKRWLELLASDNDMRLSFASEHPVIVFKRGRTIGSMLTSSSFYPPVSNLDMTLNILQELLQETEPTSVISRCNNRLCKCCESFLETPCISNIDGSVVISIDEPLSCISKNVIYVIQCMKCRKQYVGQTRRMLKERLNNHRSDIFLRKPTAVGIHFNLLDHRFSDLRIIPVVSLLTDNVDLNRSIECQWMTTLGTFYPFGLNSHPLATL